MSRAKLLTPDEAFREAIARFVEPCSRAETDSCSWGTGGKTKCEEWLDWLENQERVPHLESNHIAIF